MDKKELKTLIFLAPFTGLKIKEQFPSRRMAEKLNSLGLVVEVPGYVRHFTTFVSCVKQGTEEQLLLLYCK